MSDIEPNETQWDGLRDFIARKPREGSLSPNSTIIIRPNLPYNIIEFRTGFMRKVADDISAQWLVSVAGLDDMSPATMLLAEILRNASFMLVRSEKAMEE